MEIAVNYQASSDFLIGPNKDPVKILFYSRIVLLIIYNSE